MLYATSRLSFPGQPEMSKAFNVVIERDTDGLYVASVPALPGCYTQAHTREELMKRVREVIALHIEELGEEAEPLEFVSVEQVTIAA